MRKMNIMQENPKEIFRHLLMEYKGIPIDELELQTILENDSEWDNKKEIIAALLTIIRQPIQVVEDPNLFSQVSLALVGIAPDFMEFEFLTPEIIAVFFKSIDYIKVYYPEFELGLINDDVSRYIALCCAEDGFYFLTENLSVFQKELLEILQSVYNNKIDDSDLDKCKDLWSHYKNTNPAQISENELDPNMIQIQKNLLIKSYLKELFS